MTVCTLPVWRSTGGPSTKVKECIADGNMRKTFEPLNKSSPEKKKDLHACYI